MAALSCFVSAVVALRAGHNRLNGRCCALSRKHSGRYENPYGGCLTDHHAVMWTMLPQKAQATS
jgi:hypothetical protein